MAEKPFEVVKLYKDRPFILTDRKLSRIVEVAKDRLERVEVQGKYTEQHEVKFRNGKVVRIDSLRNILALDNSKKNPISSLFLTFEINDEDNILHKIEIAFNCSELYRHRIWVEGESKDLGWLQETVDAIEEQVERTIPNDMAYVIKRRASVLSIIALLSFFITFLSLLSILPKNSGNLGLSKNQISNLASLSSSAKAETDKIDFMFQYLSMTLEKDKTSEPYILILKNYKTYLMGIPILLGMFSAIVAVLFFYPNNIFAWGDCGESYDATVARRKIIWYGVVLALVIGVLGNLFVVGATS